MISSSLLSYELFTTFTSDILNKVFFKNLLDNDIFICLIMFLWSYQQENPQTTQFSIKYT